MQLYPTQTIKSTEEITIFLNGYQILETLHEGANTVIYRGVRELDNCSVIIKTLKSEYPTIEEITRLRHEYKIIQPLYIEGVIKTYALENCQHSYALILEDFTGLSLKESISPQKLSLLDFLEVAINLAQTLGHLHLSHILHKDIKPNNILINPKTGQIKIIDFSISSRLSKETPSLSNPNLLEGTLAYMSPEQTGRMNRSLDYRTDFYSLGITFYEMLTGQLPFNSTDAMELIHCHIAKVPVPPHHLNREVPPAVSDIVMKLVAKTAEDRYQSAWGLKTDLEECLRQLQTTGKIEGLIPGKLDKSGQFLIPQKLYGRDADVATLLESFVRVGVSSDDNSSEKQIILEQNLPLKGKLEQNLPLKGKAEMMLVSGYSGIGKTSVVNEIYKPIVKARGYFIAGKFDQFKRNIPYAAIIQAFQSLIRQLLTENPEKIAVWKEKLDAAFAQNGRVITDVIPEVELIVGVQPEVPNLGPAESQNRFNRLFKQFIHVFTTKEHPLVLFLDDLQWADSASLKLIQLLITDTESRYLLVLGAYRDNEVSPTHPLILTLEEIQKAGAAVNHIVLKPLGFENVNQLVSDTLHSETRTTTLAELLFSKTGGNPFFLTQLLQTLHAERLLNFDFVEGRWLWDMEKIQAIGITDFNVVELVARNIQKLQLETQEVLKLAACIGNSFNLDVLAIVNEKSMLTTANELWEALQAGLILPLSNAYKIPLFFDKEQQGDLLVENVRIGYKFLHDRVQQAAYSLIPEDQKKAVHLKIGQLLLQKTAKSALEENIFDIVNQLNIGLELITNPSEKEELAKLNLIAVRKAKAANAYEAAVRYANVGLGLLPASGWQNHYELTRDLHVEAVEVEYLNTNYEQAKQLAEIVLREAESLLDKVKVYEIKIQFYIAQNLMEEAINTALEVLKMLGVFIPKNPNKINILVGVLRTKLTLTVKQIEDLAQLPEMTDPYKLAAMRILIAVLVPAFLTAPNLFPLVTFKMVNLAVRYGNSPLSAYGYTLYGWLLCGALGDINSGYKFGQLGIRLLEQFDARDIKCKVINIFNAFIRHWKDHVRETIQPFVEALQISLETGNIEYTGYSTINYCNYLFLLGEDLSKVNSHQRQYIDLMRKLKQEYVIHSVSIGRQAVLNLLNLSEDRCSLIGESFNENEMLPVFKEANILPSLFTTYFYKLMLAYLFKDYKGAIENASLAEPYAVGVSGFLLFSEHNFYYSLALLGFCSSCDHQKNNKIQQQTLKQVNLNQTKLKQWAVEGPDNYQHKYLLVEAEKARILGQEIKAMKLYDCAIQGAKEQGYIQEEALGNELAAEFYLACGREKVAKTYMTEAYYGYIRWGATAKVKDLDERYPQLIFRTPQQASLGLDITQTTSSIGKNAQILDLATVLKSSLVLSGEIVLSNLLDKLMKVVIENAGAQKGLFLTKHENQWVIEAEGLASKDDVTVTQSISIDATEKLPISVLNYVERTRENLVLDDASNTGTFAADPYIAGNQPKSILCSPLIHSGKLTGILYLENNLTKGAFTPDRLKVLNLLTAQISISIENARLYEREREKSQQLEQSLYKLQQTQSQLVQTEKISSLGQLVAGVAHEVNNPVSFINGNLHHATQYVKDLLKHLQLYQKYLPAVPNEILEDAEEIDLEFLMEDLPKMLSSMQVGTDRIKEIMQSLRNFSRVDTAEKKPTDIHAGIDSTLMILQHRLKAKGEQKAIVVVKEYGELPLVECYAGQLNQVFMNLLANAIDAMQEARLTSEKEIRIRTELVENNRIAIQIQDNGPGMTEAIQSKLFEPFFTTKPVGKGTGLGLSISHQIIVEKHGGNLQCFSDPGQGAKFVIEIPTQENPN
ncbi:MAG: AAA family ATPase [Microcoleus vaginatus WJT46-NPBG5]|jgi:predicted ATPase/signal transduction histidine kinase/tRNA A-37 threonylcarbamoyl transferase component Bud32|nr:AAA family ATPase [Microcoleus vaginatus WJT46-NPBG5]